MIIDDMTIYNSVVDRDRMRSLAEKLEKVKDLAGGVCEVGVYRGGTARLLCLNTNEKVFLIDTFEGLPQECEFDNHHRKGEFNNTSIEHIKNILSDLSNYEIIKQEFPKGDTSKLDNLKFKFVHLDVDLYESVKNCLEYFYPKMVDGGYIIFDDYGWFLCLGAKKAVDEFFVELKEKPVQGANCQYYIIKEGEKC